MFLRSQIFILRSSTPLSPNYLKLNSLYLFLLVNIWKHFFTFCNPLVKKVWIFSTGRPAPPINKIARKKLLPLHLFCTYLLTTFYNLKPYNSKDINFFIGGGASTPIEQRCVAEIKTHHTQFVTIFNLLFSNFNPTVLKLSPY